jgi:pimeloyl-ACP methyl ester carboxylesterase
MLAEICHLVHTFICMESKTDVYIYGYTGNEESLDDFAKAFSGQNNYFVVNLPGFSDGAELSDEQQRDAGKYAELVWSQIKLRSHSAKIRIIGHSHGAMITYCLAVAHPDEIESVVLICPVSEPRLMVRTASYALLLASKLIGTKTALKCISMPIFVDIVTNRLHTKSWSKEAFIKIRDIRRREAKGYNQAVIDCVKQVAPFKHVMGQSQSKVKAIILSTDDDKVAGGFDHDWFGARLLKCSQIRTYGGHQCLVAEPYRIADVIRKNEVQ